VSLEKLMTKEVTSLPEKATVMDAAKFMLEMNVGSVIVVDGSKPMGILTDRDIMTKVMIEGKDAGKVMVKDIMVAPVTAVSVDEDILDVTEKMNESKVRRFPVVNGKGTVIGMISLDDILICLGKEMQNIADALKFELDK